jgi:hypothetical protein
MKTDELYTQNLKEGRKFLRLFFDMYNLLTIDCDRSLLRLMSSTVYYFNDIRKPER